MEVKRNDGEWTDGRYRSFITSTLRGGVRRWPPKWKALKAAELGRKINKKSGKLAMHYTCAVCKLEHVAKDVQVDHIEPVVDPAVGFLSWDVYIDRMFCNSGNLQVLCMVCHQLKTKEEKNVSKRGRSVVSPRVKRVRVRRKLTTREENGMHIAIRFMTGFALGFEIAPTKGVYIGLYLGILEVVFYNDSVIEEF